MNIEYKILWVEDDKSWYGTTLELFSDIVADLGFKLESKKCENIDEVKEEISLNNLKEYDMLLVDFTLKNSASGDKIIEFIRSIKDEPILTDVLFYSSAVENVRDSMHQLGLEGVYTADRKEIETKFELVLKTTLKKVQDLNNMRGLIMAETSDIDSIMMNIIQTVIEQNSFEIGNNLVPFIFDSVSKKVNLKKSQFDVFFKNQNINQVLKDSLMFDTSQKILAIQFIIDSIDHDITAPHKGNEFSKSYTELKQKRDLLAHVIEVYEDGRTKLKSGNRELEFTDEFCIDIRIRVKRHADNLEDILSILTKK